MFLSNQKNLKRLNDLFGIFGILNHLSPPFVEWEGTFNLLSDNYFIQQLLWGLVIVPLSDIQLVVSGLHVTVFYHLYNHSLPDIRDFFSFKD